MGWTPQVRWDKTNRVHYFRCNGRKYARRDYAKACRLFAEMVGQKLSVGRPNTVVGLIAVWLQQNPSDQNEWSLRSFDEFAGPKALDELPEDLLLDYLKHLQDKGYAAGTIRTRMSIARRVLDWGIRKKWFNQRFDAPKLPRVVRSPRDIPPDQRQKVIEYLEASPRRRHALTICRFMLEVGCRPGEACNLEWSEVRLDTGTCVIPAHKTAEKTGEPRILYLTPQAEEILRRQPTGGRYVFLSSRGQPYTSHGLHAIVRPAGAFPYQFRHTFAQNALDQASLEDVSKLLGHRSLATTQIYAQVRDRRARAVAANLISPLQRRPPGQAPADAVGSGQHERPRVAPRYGRRRGTGPARQSG